MIYGDEETARIARGFFDGVSLVETSCICGHTGTRGVASSDRFGIPIATVECHHCGTVRAAVRPSGPDLERYYHEGWFDRLHPGQAAKCSSGYYERQWALSCAMAGLGDAPGRFADEVSPGPWGGAIAHLGGTWTQRTSGCVDVMMAHHVLEHCADPVHELAVWATRLLPGGCLVVTVPDATSDSLRGHRLVREFGVDAWWTFDHLWHWTRETIRQPFGLAGLSTVIASVPGGVISDVGSLAVAARRS